MIPTGGSTSSVTYSGSFIGSPGVGRARRRSRGPRGASWRERTAAELLPDRGELGHQEVTALPVGAVDDHGVARDVARPRGAEEHRGPAELAGMPDSVGRGP